MKTFASVLAAAVIAPILLFGGCAVLLTFSMAETERETRECMARGISRSRCTSMLYQQSSNELNDSLNELGRSMGK